MRISGTGARIVLGAAFCLSLLAVGGCTKYASPDDLKKLDEAKAAVSSAEADLGKAKTERQKLEKQLTAKQAELESAKAELEKVKAQ